MTNEPPGPETAEMYGEGVHNDAALRRRIVIQLDLCRRERGAFFR